MKKFLIIILTITGIVACNNQLSKPSATTVWQLAQIKHSQIKAVQSGQTTIGEAVLTGNFEETAI